MGFLGIKSSEEKRNERKIKKWGNRSDDYMALVDSLLSQLGGQSERAYESAGQTAQERFGDQMQLTQDKLQQSGEANRTNLTRAVMAQGGGQQGVGQMGTVLNQQQQGTNQAIQNSLQDFYQMNQMAKTSDLRRGDRLLGNQTAGAQNQFNQSQQLMQGYSNLERQRKQANKQLFSDLAGTAMTAWAIK